jgi:hypothetical protein
MNRDEIIEHLQPAIDELVDRITALVPELVRAQLVEAIGKLTDAPASEPAKKTPKKRAVALRDIKPAKSPARPACSKCGETGHNARSCGRAPKGNPHGPKRPLASDVVAKSPPIQQTLRSLRCDRGGRQSAPKRVTRPTQIATCLFTRSSPSPSDQGAN